MLTLRRELETLAGQLAQAHELLASSLGQVETLRARIGELEQLGQKGDAAASLEALQRLGGEQRQTLDAARERGKGAGMLKVIDEAVDIDREQAEVIEGVKGDAQDLPRVASALERHRELGQTQQSKLSAEIGKFEAQGMRDLLEQIRSLGEQQEQIVRQLLSAG